MTDQDNAYFNDSYLFTARAEVIAGGVDELGKAWIAVSPNIFHPRGGGQPADSGTVDGIPITVDRNDDGLITLALPATARVRSPDALPDARPDARPDAAPDALPEAALDALPVARFGDRLATADAAGPPVPARGARVRTAVVPGERLLHAALHTTGHVLGYVGEERGWFHAGHSHYPGQARLDFDPRSVSEPVGTAEERDDLRARLQARMDELIAGCGAVGSETAADGMRTVTIAGVNAEPCGGTHVRDLGCLVGVRILDLKVKRGALKVRYEASHAENRQYGGDPA